MPTPAAEPMKPSDWQASFARCLGILLDGQMKGEVDSQNQPIVGETVLLLVNASDYEIPFTLPDVREKEFWEAELDMSFPKNRRGDSK
jgi:isoamylase